MRIDYHIFRDDLILEQKPGDDGVGFVWSERLGRIEGHSSTDVVVQGRGIGPVTADGAHRCWCLQRILPADQPVLRTLCASRPMANGTLGGKDLRTLFGCPFPRR